MNAYGKTAQRVLTSTGILCAALGSLISATAARAQTQNVIFTIDQQNSTWGVGGYDQPGNINPYQAQFNTGLSTSVSGHFVVSFDPTNDNPQSVQFIGGNTLSNGFFQPASPYAALPGVGGSGPAAPANVAGQTADGSVEFALRNITWNINSSTLSPTTSGALSSTYNAAATSYYVLSGTNDYVNGGVSQSVNYTGSNGLLSGGTWTLSESAAGSGSWTLGFNGYLDNNGGGANGGNIVYSANTVAHAQFSTNNVVTVPSSPSTPTTVDVLGGSSSTGGVSITLPAGTVGGSLVVQSETNSGALTQQEISAAASNPVFAASLYDSSTQQTQPIQAWVVSYPPELSAGQTATVVFHYDPSLLPANTNYSELGIWHFSSVTNSWNFGGTVNTSNDTITYVTDSFSPFVVGVPEPSSIVLCGLAVAGLLGYAWRRKRVN